MEGSRMDIGQRWKGVDMAKDRKE